MFVYKLLLEFHKIWDIIDKFQPHFPIKKVRLFSVQYPKILFSLALFPILVDALRGTFNARVRAPRGCERAVRMRMNFASIYMRAKPTQQKLRG